MSISYKDYYAILGVEKGASKEAIAKAYKTLARKYHPDLNKGDKTSEEKFKEINEAYDVLKDDAKRAQYDALGSDWQNDARFRNYTGEQRGSSGYSSFFESLFGQGFGGFSGFSQAQPFEGAGYSGSSFESMFGHRPSTDVNATISVTLEEVAKGSKKQVALQDPTTGSTKKLEITIPEGIQDGGQIRLKGQGASSRYSKGDLYLTVTYEKHPLFSHEGNDILYTAHVAPWVLVLGGTITVPTLYGNIALTIHPNTKALTKMRIPKKGIGSSAKKGNQIVTLIPDAIPEKTNSDIIATWEKLQKLYETA